MVQRTAYGDTTEMVIAKDITANEYLGLFIIIGIILFLGVYPKPLLDMTAGIARVLVP
jgi:NADH:ubiquinone oxidoreductase subunit 4 (subunit M)